MKTQIFKDGFNLWLSANDTEAWANRAGACWPCSSLEDHRLFVQFDSNGLCDMAIDGKDGIDCDGTELSAIVADHMRNKLPKDHPCYSVAVGQFS